MNIEVITVTPIERDAIIAALRLLAEQLEGATLPARIFDIMADSGSALAAPKVDALAERINCKDDLPTLLAKIRDYDATLNAQEKAPTGDDYNALLDMVGI